MIVTLAVRVLQLLFAGVVLALSVILINDFGPPAFGFQAEKAPYAALMGYGAFCGGAGILFAIAGIGSAFFEPLQGLIMLIIDGLAAFFIFAGAIAYAAIVGAGSCTDTSDSGYLGQKFNVFRPDDTKFTDGNAATELLNDIEARCREFQADTAFLWFLFGTFAVTLVLSFLGKSGGRGGSIV
ncbi:hypothetical protein G7Y89_g3503 [Cudoniella acicularis]|uniref:MARVEL domain-containing protein n=1 Tax=Cudoniella acicularis TaxID=354080 RepID=A0A8H4RR93_9HELO|nr:hypothetical protein G7Y89_g3503 [Cudoniella acicularis]